MPLFFIKRSEVGVALLFCDKERERSDTLKKWECLTPTFGNKVTDTETTFQKENRSSYQYYGVFLSSQKALKTKFAAKS